MGDGSLSQEEIDALLQGADDLGGAMDMGEVPAGLSDEDLGSVRSLASDVAQSMGMTLSTITGKPVTIESATVDLITRDTFTAELEGQVVQVTADFMKGAAGQHSYVLGRRLTAKLSCKTDFSAHDGPGGRRPDRNGDLGTHRGFQPDVGGRCHRHER